MIGAEPALGVSLPEAEFDQALLAIADFVDLKSPYMLGHARAVSNLAAETATKLGLGGEEVEILRRAGLANDLGRLGVSNAIWDKRGALGAGEWERVRMHPYLTERMLHQSTALAPLGAVAVQNRERLDGSGYPRGLSGGAISTPARSWDGRRLPVDVRAASLSRGAPARGAAKELRAEVRAGRMDGDVVEAVLGTAGHRVARRREGPAGLTAREVDVLRLVSRGMSSKEVAARLVISPKTARNHIEHIYGKIGASNRAGASLFAMQHGLIPDGDLHHLLTSKDGQLPDASGPSASLRCHERSQNDETRQP